MPTAETQWGDGGNRRLVRAKDLAWLAYLYPARWLTDRLPIPAAYALWDALAWLGAASLRGPRRRLQARLQLAFPSTTNGPSTRKIAVDFFRNAIVRFGGDLLLPRLVRDGRLNNAEVVHLERLTTALANGTGAILVSGHFTGSRAAHVYLAARGFPSTTVRNLAPKDARAGKLGIRFLQRRYVQFLSELIGNEISVQDPDCSLKMIALLRSGGLVRVHVDAAFSREVQRRKFLGATVPFGTGVFHLAWIVKVPLIPMMCLGNSRKLRIEFGEPIDPANWTDRHTFADAALDRVLQLMERQIRGAPAEWDLWIYW